MAVGMQRVQKEFVLKKLLEESVPLLIHHESRRIPGSLLHYDRKEIEIEVEDGAALNNATLINVYFSLNNHMMTFKCRIRERNGERLRCTNPDYIYRRLERSFERVQPGESMRVKVFPNDGSFELDFPRTNVFDPVDSEVKLGIHFDPTTIASLMKSFRMRAARIAAESKIVMFRSREPSGFAEQLVARTGKLLVLPLFVAERLTSASISDRILGEQEIISVLSEGRKEGVDDAINRLEIEQKRLRNENIREELFCPVIFREYAVGYIYLVQGSEGSYFSSGTIDFVRQFTRVLAYALNANGYFQGSSRPLAHEAALIDISASGLLFTLEQADNKLKEFDEILVAIEVGERTVEANGKVMRMFTGNTMSYVGVQFTSMSDEDSHFLLSVLYGSEYGGSVDLRSEPEPFDGSDFSN